MKVRSVLAGCRTLTDYLLGSSHSRFSCAASSPSTPQSPKSEYHMRPTLFRFVSTTLPASPFLAINTQTGRFIIEQATFSQGDNFAFCTCSNTPLLNLQLTRFRRQSYMEAEFDTEDSLPQDLVSAGVLRECSQSKAAEFRAVD
ncbi:hypothetical protein K443DRAFT_537818 [Laccaria amethystina LaAM-08-1]|uniref:Uncharacterized protein n=1 Tax=Laccaria amethystina LaAM-08-1 TaxID=1095629 RepID=A0A0C9WRS6_9AGAR|nr:hypothetical protein K443DRAFT_537818 [Laccaria amethystina LaAM-08-1]